MLTFVFAILSLFSSAIAWFFAARASKDMGSLRSLFLFQLIGIPFFLLLLPWAPTAAASSSWVSIALIGLYETFVMLLLFYAMRIGNVSVVIPITDGYALITTLLSFLILKEVLSLERFTGAVLVIAGIALISMKVPKKSVINIISLQKGVVPALLAAVGTGVFFFLVGIVVRESNWFVTSFGIRVVISITTLAIIIIKRESLNGLWKSVSWKWILPAAALDVFGFSFYNMAVSRGDISYVTLVASPQSLITVLLGYFVLKENVKKTQWLGIILTLTGLITLQL